MFALSSHLSLKSINKIRKKRKRRDDRSCFTHEETRSERLAQDEVPSQGSAPRQSPPPPEGHHHTSRCPRPSCRATQCDPSAQCQTVHLVTPCSCAGGETEATKDDSAPWDAVASLWEHWPRSQWAWVAGLCAHPASCATWASRVNCSVAVPWVLNLLVLTSCYVCRWG